uniref:Uncharacterized protein n=1 Tax=Anopheles dirus TaxID=7168 RepID=A0A1Y9H2R3_9DIPT
MSLQVSNQTTSGRRTPQVYQGFGGVGAGAAATTPTATNGSGATNANTGSVGRPSKGGNKQSQIPVAIGSGGGVGGATLTHPEAPVPQTAVVHPGTGGSTDGQKHLGQLDHVYGTLAMKQSPAAMQQLQTSAGSVRVQATNGSQAAAANATAEKNGTSQKKNASANGGGGGGDGGPAVATAAAKKSAEVQQTVVVPPEGGAKVRDSPRSRAQQQKSDDVVVQPKSEKNVAMESSLLAEKPLKGFGADGEEMESLLLEPWEFEESTAATPARSNAGAKSKSQKTTPQAQVSPFKAGGKLETEQSPAKAKAEETAGKNRSPKATDVAPATPTGDTVIGRPLRSISGRRSTRPISDIKFTHHRRSTDQHNDSFSSLNVTVGSEVGNDSLLRTPLSASRKRKDMTPESTSTEAEGAAVDSPKRARLDFSGFLGMVATPVTMLKNRLSRVKLQSTPRSLAVEEEDASKVVTAEATTTTTTTNVTPQKDEASTGEAATAMEVDEKEKPDAATGQTMPEKDAAEPLESSSTVADDEVEVKIVTDGQQPQKQWCSIM